MQDLLSPTKRAECVIDELLAAAVEPKARREHMIRLLRLLIRDQFEQCAAVAESWVAENDRFENLDSLDVCDGIAESLRRAADERVLPFTYETLV